MRACVRCGSLEAYTIQDRRGWVYTRCAPCERARNRRARVSDRRAGPTETEMERWLVGRISHTA